MLDSNMTRNEVNRFLFLLAGILVLGVGGFPYEKHAHSQPSPTSGPNVIWHPLAIGAGGQLTGIDIAPDGTMVVKADVFGAYIWNATTNRWDQVITASSGMAAAGSFGVWEIRIAPSLTTRLFMIYGNNVYRSDDRGSSWKKTTLQGISGADAGGSSKFANQKMAIDPVNPDVVYVGTPTSGVRRSFDAGATWQQVSDIAPGMSPGNAGIVFDPNSGTTNGRTNTIYIPSYGQGVWRSTNAGATWTQIASPSLGGPTKVWTAQIGADGTYWCSEHDQVWKYSKGRWTRMIRPATGGAIGAYAVAVDPNQPGRVIFLSDNAKSGGETLDNGATTVGDVWYAHYPPPGVDQIAKDIPWLQDSDTSYFTLGDAKINPTNGRLYIAEGIGVWWADWPKTFTAFSYHSQSSGIEELVTNDIIVPPGGKPITASWDRPFFRSDNRDEYPSKYGPINGAFAGGWGLDYASSDPAFIVGLANWGATDISGYSPDGGRTWHQFSAKPDWKLGGCIAAATPSNIVWVPGNNGLPYYTKDGGASWKLAPGLPADGWIFAYYLKRRIAVADRVNIGVFYLYNFKHGLYKSTDGGDHWSLVHLGEISPASGFNARLRATPGHAGDLWFTSGGQTTSHPYSLGYFKHSTDGGANWLDVPRVREVLDFGFGKPKTPHDYPVIYIVGWVDDVYGIWRSEDEGGSWINIGKYPNNNIDNITVVNGDMSAYGVVYTGFAGSGFAYGKLQER